MSEFSLLRGDLPGWLQCEQITLEPDAKRACPSAWRQAIGVVERGALTLTGANGGSVELHEGAVLFFPTGSRLYNHGSVPTVLVVGYRAD